MIKTCAIISGPPYQIMEWTFWPCSVRHLYMPFAHSLLKGKARRGNSSYPIDHLWYLINILLLLFFFFCTCAYICLFLDLSRWKGRRNKYNIYVLVIWVKWGTIVWSTMKHYETSHMWIFYIFPWLNLHQGAA